MFTAKEALLIACIAESEYNSGDPLAYVWSDCVGDEFARRGGNRRGMGGIMASLVAKGAAKAGFDGEAHVCRLTEAGVAAYRALRVAA